MDWEFTVLNMMQKYLRSPVLDAITITVSTLGKLGLIWIVMAIICLITKKYRRLGTKMSLALILTLINCSFILKPVVQRIRPYILNPNIQLMLSPEFDTSFPSGHTFFAFSTATVCFMYIAGLSFQAIAGFMWVYITLATSSAVPS